MFLRQLGRTFVRHRTALTIDACCAPMHPLLVQRAEALGAEYAALQHQMEGTFDHDVSRRFSSVGGMLDHYNRYKQDMANLAALVELYNDDADELAAEAEAEIRAVVPQVQRATHMLEKRLLPPVAHQDRPAMLELRPGVGGSEAALFARDLLDMYTNFANHMRWPWRVESESVSAGGFLTEAMLTIDHPGAYSVLRHESGVHRVQRIPATEAKGRIHTSTAAVVVLPKMSDGTEQTLREDERLFAPGEVRIDTMRAGGKGGQHVNTTDSAVRLVHIPTGITVMQQDERSQPKNKAKAFSILRARLAHLEREREMAEQRKLRTDQVTSTDRLDKIRTYNYPQNRVTDHRCGVSIHDMAAFMAGERLEELVERLEETEFEERLQALVHSTAT